MRVRFIRETLLREDDVMHFEGDEVEMSEAQFARWDKRGAVTAETHETKPKPKKRTARKRDKEK